MDLLLPLPGTLGNVAGGASDGVLAGQLTFDDPDDALTKTLASAVLCITDDGGSYVNETTPANEATTDDVEVLPATPAVDDAAYFGIAAQTFDQIDFSTSTQGDGVWTIEWQYWDGSAWSALSDVVDGTSAFTSATGLANVAFTIPGDWEKNTVDNVLAYWVRANVTAYTSVVTAPKLGQVWINTLAPTWADETADMTDAGAGDVQLLPLHPQVGDGVYLGYSEQFCKIKLTYSQARTGTATITLK